MQRNMAYSGDLTTEEEDRILYDCFSTEQGRKALTLLRELFYDRPSYLPDHPHPHHTVYKEGQRDVIGFIMIVMDKINFPGTDVNRTRQSIKSALEKHKKGE